jgi:hypothetical protein
MGNVKANVLIEGETYFLCRFIPAVVVVTILVWVDLNKIEGFH